MWPTKLRFSSSMLIGAALFTLMFHVSLPDLPVLYMCFLKRVCGDVTLLRCVEVSEASSHACISGSECRCCMLVAWIHQVNRMQILDRH
jgi:hypothetical protein